MKRYTKAFWSLLFITATLLMTSCDKDSRDRAKQREQEKKDRAAFIKEHFPGAEEATEGMYIILEDKDNYTKSQNIDRNEGPGIEPVAGANLSVRYWGYLMDEYESGKPFDSNEFSMGPIAFQLYNFQSGVITGWHYGLAKLKKGGKATLIIPSDLAYKSYGRGSVIPPYTTLVFDVYLTDVDNP